MRKSLCYLMVAMAVAGWVFSMIGFVRPFKNAALRNLWKSVTFSWVFSHPIELFISGVIGKAAEVAPIKTIIKTLIFGISWWLPVKIGVIKRGSSAASHEGSSY